MESHPSSSSQGAITPPTPMKERLQRIATLGWKLAAVCFASLGGYLLVALPTLLICPSLVVWPAAGVAFAAGFLGGVSGATGIFLGTIAVNLTWAALHQQALPMGIAGVFSVSAASALAALAAGSSLRKLSKGSHPFGSPSEAVLFCFFGAGFYALAMAGISTLPQSAMWKSLDFHDLLVRDYVGVLIATPPILVWINREGTPLLVSRKWEVFFLTLLAIALIALMFGPGFEAVDPTFRLGVFLLVPLFWVANRFDLRISTLLTLLCFLLVLKGTSMGYGIYGDHTHGGNQIMRAQVFLGIISSILLIAGATAETRTWAETKLRLAFENTQHLISSANVVILGMSEEGKLKIFNRTAEETTGYSMDELSGNDWFEKICVNPDGDGANPFMEFRETGQLASQFETSIRTKKGEERLISWQNSPIHTAESDISMVCYGMDITERRQAEEALKKSSEQIRDLYTKAPCGYHSVDADGTILRINDTELEQLGYEREELIGRDIRELISPESLEQFEAGFAELIEKGEIANVELEMVRKDGSLLPIALSSTVIRDEEGQFRMSRSITVDLTERRQANAQLREAWEFLDSIIDNIPSMVFVKENESLRFVRLNKAGEELLGTSREEILGKSDYDLFPKEEADFFTATDREVMAKGTLLDIPEEPILTPKGIRLLHTQKIPIVDEDGTPRYLLGISQDITELRRAEEELNRFFNLSIDLFCIAGFDGYFKRLNPAWESLGYTREELMAGPFLDFVHPEDREASLEQMEKLTQGIEVVSFENRFVCKDGSHCWLLWQARSVIGENLIYAAAHNCTERKKAEVALRETSEDLRRSNEQLEQFAYVASHDLQEPLRMVGSYTRLLSQRYHGKLDEDADKFIDYAVDGSKRMQSLIQDLLAYSRVGTRAVPFTVISGEELLSNVLRTLKFTIEEAHAEVTHDPLPEIYGEPIQIGQVFQNLIANAIKFHGEELPKVHVRATRGDGEWVFSVRDNGIGISPEYYDRIFAIFQRLHSRDRYEGTGIGLAVCKKIVERHGGRIWVEANPGAETIPGNGQLGNGQTSLRDGPVEAELPERAPAAQSPLNNAPKPGPGITFCFTIPDIQIKNT